MKNHVLFLFLTIGATMLFQARNTQAQNDIALSQPKVHFLAEDTSGFVDIGFYSKLPLNLNMPIVLGAEIANIGSLPQSNIKLTTTLIDSTGNVILELADSIATLAIGDTALLAHPDTMLPAEIGPVSVVFHCSQNEIDAFPANNTNNDIAIDLNNRETLDRNFELNNSISVLDYAGGMAGDFLGIEFYATSTDTVQSMSVFIHPSTTPFTMIYGQLYKKTFGSTALVHIETDEYTITPGDLGTWVELPFMSIVPGDDILEGNTYYIAGIECYMQNGTDIVLGSDSNLIHNFAVESRVRIGTSWYYDYEVPMVKVNFQGYSPTPSFTAAPPDFLCASQNHLVSFDWLLQVNDPFSLPITIDTFMVPDIVTGFTDLGNGTALLEITTSPNDLYHHKQFGFTVSNGTNQDDIIFWQQVTETLQCNNVSLQSIGPWQVNTSNLIHSIEISPMAPIHVNNTTITQGDFLGVFYDSTNFQSCAGLVQWTGNPVNMMVYGDTSSSSTGQGNTFYWKLWTPNSGIFDMHAYYDSLWPNLGTFAPGGQSSIDSLASYGIMGTITQPTKQGLQSGMCVLYKQTPSGFRAIQLEHVQNGLYGFHGLDAGKYLTHIIPEVGQHYGFPCYKTLVYHWTETTPIPVGGSYFTDPIELSQLTPYPSGTHNINGMILVDYLTSYETHIFEADWFGNPSPITSPGLAQNILLLLKNTNQEIIGYTLSDENGEFSFANLPNGNYTVIVEKPGLISEEAIVSFYETQANTETITFHLDQNHVYAIDQSLASNSIDIFPNPVSDILYLTINNSKHPTQIKLFSATGQEVNIAPKQTQNNININLEQHPPGIYLLQIETNNTITITKIIKN